MNVALKYAAVAFISSAAAFAAVHEAGALGTEACPAPSALMSCPQQAQPHPAPRSGQLAQAKKGQRKLMNCYTAGWEHCRRTISYCYWYNNGSCASRGPLCVQWQDYCIEA